MGGFKVGDIVGLKSGGPSMTIVEITPKGVRCYWFVYGLGDVQRETFPPEALEPVNKNDGSWKATSSPIPPH